MSFQEKYLKYKSKYLALLKNNECKRPELSYLYRYPIIGEKEDTSRPIIPIKVGDRVVYDNMKNIQTRGTILDIYNGRDGYKWGDMQGDAKNEEDGKTKFKWICGRLDRFTLLVPPPAPPHGYPGCPTRLLADYPVPYIPARDDEFVNNIRTPQLGHRAIYTFPVEDNDYIYNKKNIEPIYSNMQGGSAPKQIKGTIRLIKEVDGVVIVEMHTDKDTWICAPIKYFKSLEIENEIIGNNIIMIPNPEIN